jgi:molecular chaperone DnaK
MDRLIDSFKMKEGVDLKDNPMALQRIKEEAENAKKQLSQTESVDISIPFITTGEDGQPRNLEETLTRAQFEKICSDLIERCRKPVMDALKDSKLSTGELNEVILV